MSETIIENIRRPSETASDLMPTDATTTRLKPENRVELNKVLLTSIDAMLSLSRRTTARAADADDVKSRRQDV
jgi:hypothetical protein